MRFLIVFSGLGIVISLISGVLGLGLDIAKGLIDINENKLLSVIIIFFVSWSLVQMLFFKHAAREIIGGTIVGLGIAFWLISGLATSIILYACLFITENGNVQGQNSKNS